jgi:hypothetical protein
LNEEMNRFSCNYGVPHLSIRNDGKGEMRVFYNDEPFIPILRIKLNIPQIQMLTKSLCEFLSEPLAAVNKRTVMTT